MTVQYTLLIPACCEDEHGYSQCGRPAVLLEEGTAIDVEAVLAHVQHLIGEGDFGRCHAFCVEIDDNPVPLEFYERLKK